VLRVLGGMEGARARRRAGPEAMPKPWKSRDEKKVVHPPLVTVSFLWALVEAGAGVAARPLYSLSKYRGVPSSA